MPAFKRQVTNSNTPAEIFTRAIGRRVSREGQGSARPSDFRIEDFSFARKPVFSPAEFLEVNVVGHS
jgi:hypothetical protein